MLCMLVAMVDSPEDKRKIEKLYEKYDSLMFQVARKILTVNEDVEDAVFSAWERIIKNIDKISEIECKETKNFVVIITERGSIDYYRKQKRRLDTVPLEDEVQPYLFTKENGFSDFETVEWIRSIPKKYAEVLVMFYVNEMSIKNIAEVLGIKEGSVASRLSRGRKLLEKGK